MRELCAWLGAVREAKEAQGCTATLTDGSDALLKSSTISLGSMLSDVMFDWAEILSSTDYCTCKLEHNIKAIIKPQHVDAIPRAIKGKIGEVIGREHEHDVVEFMKTELELKDVLDRETKVLSGGELQRFARCIAAQWRQIPEPPDVVSAYLQYSPAANEIFTALRAVSTQRSIASAALDCLTAIVRYSLVECTCTALLGSNCEASCDTAGPSQCPRRCLILMLVKAVLQCGEYGTVFTHLEKRAGSRSKSCANRTAETRSLM